MAYNPFDDVIENDPAYMQTGDETPLPKPKIGIDFLGNRQEPTRSVIPQRRVNYIDDGQSERMADIARGPVNFLGDLFAQTMGRIAENMVNPEAAERGRQKNEINKEIANYFGVVPQQITPAMNEEYFKKFGKEYQQLNFQEGINSGLNFFLEDAIKGSQAIQSGEKRFTDLPGNQKLGVGLLPLEFWLGGFGRKAAQGVSNEVLSKYKDMPLGELVANPQARQEIPEVVAEVENQYPILITQQQRVNPVDETPSVVMAPEPGTGLASSTPIKQQVKNKITNYFENNSSPTSRTRLMEELGLSDNKSLVKSLFNEKTGDSDLKKYSSLLMDEVDLRAKEQLEEGFKNLKDVEGPVATQPMAELMGVDKTLITRHLINNREKSLEKNIITEDQINLFESIFAKGQEGRTLQRDKKVSEMKNDLIANPEKQGQKGNYYLDNYGLTKSTLSIAKNTDPEIYALTTRVNKKGVPVEFGDSEKMSIGKIRNILDPQADDVDVSIITDLYRGTKNIEDYTPDQFLGLFKKQNPNYKNTRFYKNTKKAYKELEDDRLKVQNKGFKFFDSVRKDPKYGKYLKDSDRLQFGFQKAHAFPIDETTQMNRFENMAQMSDMIFVSDMTSNVRLQNRFDPDLIEIARLGSKENMDRLATIPTNADIKFMGINLPKIIERLKEYGINVVPEEFENMRQLIFGKDKGIVDQINKLYEKFDTGSVIPIGKTNYGLVGKNPKKISPEKRLNNLKKRFMEILDDQVLYEKTNGKKGKPIMRTPKKDNMEGGFIKGLQDGGEVKPVRMAIGGDPLTNLNQQQFSPDPAFEGQDYFQEAVDSGNLQAANLFNLFKVFNKPKVMATPSNVKKVEDARDPIPAPTGSQEIAPLPAGKQDFFFKSFFLDQLNSQNAPKASTPQGWREFLIKGRKVPEAEMMDTGILQYLEDTEKFFPNKKITKQDLENLYDMSPLGNLEVRVKEIKAPGFDEGQFTLDQGRPRHKGAGNAAIDEAADEYFEVVVNVPQLPGQEKVFVNSGHFSEPNVLGFTRVGTYKNADNQTVAVIQEMQTDMLTEVRKEQERLFAMVNALKRQRADLARQVEQARTISPGNVEYATNKLRQFDQQYPESFLNDLATDNLIQPFPNIVAKELIPEKTRNLNAIQDDINKLSMANVEQYADPAYKTKIFDLAQEQTKILDDLMSMNRSSNYKEKLQDFKVPSTSNREELQRIGETDTYLPSSYNMKQLESFPPIPFNKQADYVDLLIKSTIKAAKQKGIDRVAIMPADIGANPRWGKSSDEAKKKFQNLYDKVGVQQLKNIAKKYDGTLNVEKIIDPNKTNRGLTFLNKNPDGEFQVLKQIETKVEELEAVRDKYYDEEITRIASGVNEPGTIVLTREISPGQMMDYYLVEGRGDATDVGYRMIPLKENENADDALIKIVEYNPSAIDMYTISFDPSKLEEPMYLFKKKSGGTIDKDSLVSITDIYGEYGR